MTLSDGQQTAVVPISITNDDEPEFAETFVVRLESSDGDVLVGSPSQCVVTIEENDYPHGLIGNTWLKLSACIITGLYNVYV